MAEEETGEVEDREHQGPRPSKDKDAMGNDKRRDVVGQQYGATVRKRLLVYGAAVGVIVLVVIAFLTVVRSVDEKEIALKDTAPWTETAELEAPRDIDFMANGPRDNHVAGPSSPTQGDATIDRDEIFER